MQGKKVREVGETRVWVTGDSDPPVPPHNMIESF